MATTLNQKTQSGYRVMSSSAPFQVPLQPGMNKRGTALVFGDSLFESPSLGYSFASYLEDQGVYDTVINRASSVGVGFGYTTSAASGNNLYQLVQNSAVRSDITAADVIYICLGGNDITSKVEGRSTESDLSGKVTTCFNTIRTLNPDAIIYYVPSYGGVLDILKACGARGYGAQEKTAIDLFNNMNIAVASAKNNIKILSNRITDLYYIKQSDGVHPTADSVLNAYDDVLYGAYRDTKLRDLISFLDQNNQPIQSYHTQLANAYNAGIISPSADLWVLIDATEYIWANFAYRFGGTGDGELRFSWESFSSWLYIKSELTIKSSGVQFAAYTLTPPTPIG